jgi:DNA-binding CsgD family transcriptional regulator
MLNKKTTAFEYKIIALLMEGKTIQQIANILYFAKSTISYKMRKLFEKYKVTNTRELFLKIHKSNLSKLEAEIIRLQIENENLKSAVR